MSNLFMAGSSETLLVHTCVITCLVIVSAFNLDTTIPVIKQGPPNSYFGFSVAQHKEVRKINPEQLSNEVIGNYILVGAPKLNIATSKENSTGGIYRCNALSSKKDDCEILLKDQYGPGSKGDPGRHDQWLGVVVRSGGLGKGVVACAHRYKEIKETSDSTNNIYGLGMCYQMTQDLALNIDLGIGNIFTPCSGYSKVKEHEEYAFCQSGISAYITENERLIMGAPGPINWIGMINEIDIAPKFSIKRMYRSPTTMADPLPGPVSLNSYLGYSSVGGKFDNTERMYYVAGAPHSLGYGQVVFFTEMSTGNILSYETSQILTGGLPFSGFGHELMAVDVNNDGYDDLIVGCPFYYVEEKDSIKIGGAIYIYSGHADMITNMTKPHVITGRSTNREDCEKLQCRHARFGFSLAKAGDLNMDGYQDFAVGAPFEGRGAVYIYHGSAKGVQEPFSQRIFAEDLATATGWTAFGYSLSGGMDLDDNTYPDLLVGSYSDNKVALLRTRPIVKLHSKINVTPDRLNMSHSAQRKCIIDQLKYYCVEIQLCLRYTAEPVERFDEPVDIIYTITAEPTRFNSRVDFYDTKHGYSQVVEDTLTLKSQKETGGLDAVNPQYKCTTKTAYLKEQITDVLTALTFGISYRLPERTAPASTPAPGALPDINEFPILDAGLTESETMIFTEVEFVKKCGDDNICNSNLNMKVDLQDLSKTQSGMPVLEIGATDQLKVHVDVENKGEIAYQTAFFLTKPSSLIWQQSEPRDIGCVQINTTMIECKDIGSKEIGKPLKAGESTQFLLYFQINNTAISSVRLIELTAWVNTTSEELTPTNDRITIPVTVFINADIQVSGQSEPDSAIPYSGNVRGESAMTNERMIGPGVNHTFTVYNNGPGVVESSEITIYWPYEVQSTYPHGKHLLYLMQPPQVLAGGDATCYDQPEIVNVVGINSEGVENSGPDYTVANGRRRRSATAGARYRRDENEADKTPLQIREDGPALGEARDKKNIAHLDCDSKTAKCYEIRCKIGVLSPDQNVKIRIRSRLWESTLLQDYRLVDAVHIRSKGKIHIRPELNVLQSNTKNDVGYAVTVAIPSIQIVQEKPLAWWIYALAILGGIVLLVLLAVCLWKCGFFKRKRYDEVNTYNVKVEKKKDISNPTYSTSKMEVQRDIMYDENESFLKR
ncbi:integrin alpha-6-like isoform X2 [Dreissena polymorpha]|uniref:integrin alpha-6-like isoform X2 n=1 Tax=Dreissena polymorpha TaxID=45954 RepID=UPI0022647BE1|nr:integrin alpha-6-like isoform X2 [Dreissena polymorpha]